MEEQIRERCTAYIEYEEHPVFKAEVQELLEKGDEKNLSDRFYTDLAFGTGGLRGVIGGGFNRMNPYVVNRATQGLANYILARRIPDPSVAIAHDCRNFSGEFAESAARVLCRNGIKAYLFPELRPTPELSYAVRSLGATAGIVITASHNPPEYNGYKVYWSDGGQIVPPDDAGILEEARSVSGRVPTMPKEEAVSEGLLEYLGTDIDDEYLDMIGSYLHRTSSIEPGSLKVVYTPLHGTGTILVEAILGRMGVQCITVPEQREPDGNFPTVESPNPEEAGALKMAIELAAREKADLVMGTDPDSDRLGIAVRAGDRYVLITGNQLGALLCDYVFSTRKELGTLPEVPVLVKTIVTTEFQRRIAESYGAKVYDVLTGFKYIGEKIRQFEDTDEEYVFGGEESYGYLVETEVRDKDAVSTAALTAEMAAYVKAKGMTLVDYLNQLHQKHGYFEERLISRSFKGEEGVKKIADMMNEMRVKPPIKLGGQQVLEIRDYSNGNVVRDSRVHEESIDLPRSNVLQFVLEYGIFSARPSGTEPKIKFYLSCFDESDLEIARGNVQERLELLESDLAGIAGE